MHPRIHDPSIRRCERASEKNGGGKATIEKGREPGESYEVILLAAGPRARRRPRGEEGEEVRFVRPFVLRCAYDDARGGGGCGSADLV